jgi:hypothetical protein
LGLQTPLLRVQGLDMATEAEPELWQIADDEAYAEAVHKRLKRHVRAHDNEVSESLRLSKHVQSL